MAAAGELSKPTFPLVVSSPLPLPSPPLPPSPLPPKYCKTQAVRLCLKHLRDCDYTEAYHSLRKQSRVELEHPLLTQLHTVLVCAREREGRKEYMLCTGISVAMVTQVDKGDFEAAEKIMEQATEGTTLTPHPHITPHTSQHTLTSHLTPHTTPSHHTTPSQMAFWMPT